MSQQPRSSGTTVSSLWERKLVSVAARIRGGQTSNVPHTPTPTLGPEGSHHDFLHVLGSFLAVHAKAHVEVEALHDSRWGSNVCRRVCHRRYDCPKDLWLRLRFPHGVEVIWQERLCELPLVSMYVVHIHHVKGSIPHGPSGSPSRR